MIDCPRCKAKCAVDNVDYTRWECGSTSEQFYDGCRTDIDLNYMCTEPSDALDSPSPA